MITQLDIQLKAQQYLQFFQLNHLKNNHLLQSLQIKLNKAAQIIQSKWKLYIKIKKNKMATKIQSQWRKYHQYQLYKLSKLQKFKQTFYKGKIAHFILSKYFHYKLSSSKQNNHNNYNKFKSTPIKAFYQQSKIQFSKKTSFNNKLAKYFPPYITLTQTYKAQQIYIQKLRVYQKQRFSQMWQKYQQTLKPQLLKQASKKWVKKNKQIWINQQNKQINLQQYIEKQIEKIFKKQYQKYKSADIQLQNTSTILKSNILKFKHQYYQKILSFSFK